MNALKKNKLIFSSFIKDNALKVNYLDIGARGDIQSPWDLFDLAALNVIGFEPDPVEAKRLGDLFTERTYYPYALWGSKAKKIFYNCVCGPTSSMYYPNEKLESRYEKQHWDGRNVKQEIDVECTFLDDVIKTKDIPDFIKIDTQGAEFEILNGGKELLINNAPLVLVETWCEEVYKGAPLSHDIMKFMYDLGYQVFDYNVAAAWRHDNKNNIKVESKRRIIGFDFLFVKKPELIVSIDRDKFIKLLGLCELFGFRDYSFYLLENNEILSDDEARIIRAMLSSNNKVEKSMIYKLKNRILKKLGLDTALYPKLH